LIGPRAQAFLCLLGINAGLIAIGLVAIELVFGQWFVDFVVPDHRLINRTFSYPQTLYEPHSQITFARDQYGLRKSIHPVAATQIVTVGGSTTAQSFITEGQTWQDVIHQRTGMVVANAGIDGMSTQSIIEIVDDWLHRIPGLKPQYYLHYVGVNDAGLAQGPALADRPRGYSWSRRIRGRSAILQAASRLRDQWGGPLVFRSGFQVPPISGREFTRADVDRREFSFHIERFYKPNLRRLLQLHADSGELAILVTQTANPALVKRRDGAIFVVDPAAHARWAVALDEINAATRGVCSERPQQCRLIDVANDLSFEPADFYDVVHNTPAGARKLGKFLAARLPLIEGGQSRQP
jgi:hypothetical protein